MAMRRESRGLTASVVRRVIVAVAMSAGVSLPAYAQIAVTSATIVEATAEPGETYRDAIVIHNSSNTVQTVSLSQADYRFNADGATEFSEPGTESRSNSGWISLGQQAVTVPPRSDVSVSYTVAVPSTPALPAGTYWSVILVEATRTNTQTSASLSIVPTFRYAIQMATHVGKSGEPKLAFSEPHLMRTSFSVALVNTSVSLQAPAVSTLGAERSLAVDITDVGTRGCRPALRLEVYQQDGTLVHTATVQRGLVYPGASIRQTFDLPPLVPGNYTVLLLADTGIDKVQGTKFQIHVQ